MAIRKIKAQRLPGARFAIGFKSAMTAENLKPVSIETERFASACKVLNDGIATRAFPGCTFGVLAVGQQALPSMYMGALGNFTYQADSPRVTPKTVYDLASVTKVVATTTTAMLRPPCDRLRHLLAHNSGLPGYVEFFRTAATPAALLRACLELPLEAEPGTRAEYSDPGFILLGKALEALFGESLATWVRARSFSRWGWLPPVSALLRGARASIPPTEEDTTFRHRRIQGEVQDENAWLLQGAAGHAGLFSNVPDLLRFAGEILAAAAKTPAGNRKARLFNRRRSSSLPSGRARRAVRGRSAGIRPRRTPHRAALFAAFHRASGLQRLLAVDRPGCRGCRCAAHQPHLARPAEPADSRGQARLSRRRPRGALDSAFD
jgi:CubicO group peptidase (beta-lactamase class C family)